MADSTTHLDTIIQGSGSQDQQANALYDAASLAFTYGRRASTTSGTTWGYFGGKVRLAGVVTHISNGTLTLTPSTTNYVQAHPDTGAVRVFWGGVQHSATGSNAAAVNLSSVGLGYYSGGPLYSYSYFDEVRLSDVCLYSSNFTPPSAPFTLPSGVW